MNDRDFSRINDKAASDAAWAAYAAAGASKADPVPDTAAEDLRRGTRLAVKVVLAVVAGIALVNLVRGGSLHPCTALASITAATATEAAMRDHPTAAGRAGALYAGAMLDATGPAILQRRLGFLGCQGHMLGVR